MLDKDLAEIYDYKGQKLEADILICTPFTGHPVKGVHIISGRFLVPVSGTNDNILRIIP